MTIANVLGTTMELSGLINIIIISMLVVGTASFFLGKRKSEKPIIAALMGAIFTIVPVVGLVYLAILYNKPDINK